jgi:NAD(P)H-hydrate repair Nnr-like enzyme with NAD(P)H-hydrate dehydratase domain
MVFMMVQAVLFGAGLVLILLTPSLNAHAMSTLPEMIVLSVLLSAVIAWMIAPRLRARHWRARGIDGDAISG